MSREMIGKTGEAIEREGLLVVWLVGLVVGLPLGLPLGLVNVLDNERLRWRRITPRLPHQWGWRSAIGRGPTEPDPTQARRDHLAFFP